MGGEHNPEIPLERTGPGDNAADSADGIRGERRWGPRREPTGSREADGVRPATEGHASRWSRPSRAFLTTPPGGGWYTPFVHRMTGRSRPAPGRGP